ncbi:MAG TPA: universal stress protein [Planctomycetota bacterium]|jgi:nucleotide-binding universal stress UspA family protein|nr:universal stress protein [Planctomycetota bacterium]
MFDHLLVPLEGNEFAESVLPVVRRLDALGVSEITLLRTEMPVAVDEYTVACEAALHQAQKYLAEVRERLSGIKAPIRTLTQIGPAASTILEVARDRRATLILASIAHRSRLVRFLFGNVTERLVERSRIPVLAVPPSWVHDLGSDVAPGERLARNILVPLDGGQASRSILPHAVEMALATGARILLFSVISPDSRHSPDPTREEFECAEEQLYAAGADCAAAGVEFSVLMDHGEPVERILAACRDRRVDGIAMATRGRSSLSRWLAPSVTLRVLRQTGLPLLTVRAEPSARPIGLGAPPALGRH